MVISILLQKALWQWHKERGEHACICVRVWKCECMHWAGGCWQRWLFSLSIFLHNHITPTLKTDTCICNIQTRRMVLLLSLNFICGFWNHCNYDQPNTHLPNKAIFCVCVCVCACVGKDIHACTCMLHAAEWVLFFPPPSSDCAIWQQAKGWESGSNESAGQQEWGVYRRSNVRRWAHVALRD